MRIDVYPHPDEAVVEQLDRIETKLGILLENQEDIMATNEELEAVLADIDVKVSNVSADMDRLLALLAAVPPAGMTPEQQAAFDAAVAHATSIRDALSAVDAKA